jgi:hypothetical protein
MAKRDTGGSGTGNDFEVLERHETKKMRHHEYITP